MTTDNKPMPNVNNPYPGLRPFDESDANLFFGRESQTQALVKKLASNRFVAVMGSSGSGKSSLVKAGLIPLLRADYVPQQIKSAPWKIMVMTPGRNPLNNLAVVLREAFADTLEDFDDEALLEGLQFTLEDGLAELLLSNEENLGFNTLLVIDQFEELFTHDDTDSSDTRSASHNDRADFVALILDTIQQSKMDIFVVATMRSEYLGNCSSYMGLSEAFGDGIFIVPMLSISEKRAAIRGPAKNSGLTVDMKLANKIIHDVASELDQLPVMQNSLRLMYEKKVRAGEDVHELTMDDNQNLKMALDKYAESVYSGYLQGGSLRDDWTVVDQKNVELVFRNICIRDISGERVRRPATINELMHLTDLSASQIYKVVETFRADGCNFLTPFNEELAPTTEINIVHESLIRKWRRLKGWVDNEARLAVTFRQLCKEALDWRKNRKPEDIGLLEYFRLDSATKWLEEKEAIGAFNDHWCSRHWDVRWEEVYKTAHDFDYLTLLREYITKSKDFRARKKERQKKKNALTIFAVLAVVVGCVWFALHNEGQNRKLEANNKMIKDTNEEMVATNIRLKAVYGVSLASNFLQGAGAAVNRLPTDHVAGHLVVEAYFHFIRVFDDHEMYVKNRRLCNEIVSFADYYIHSPDMNPDQMTRDKRICWEGTKANHREHLKSLRQKVCEVARTNLHFPQWINAGGGFGEDNAQFSKGCPDLLSGIQAESFENAYYFHLLEKDPARAAELDRWTPKGNYKRRTLNDIFDRQSQVNWSDPSNLSKKDQIDKIASAIKIWETEGYLVLKNKHPKIALHVETVLNAFSPTKISLEDIASVKLYQGAVNRVENLETKFGGHKTKFLPNGLGELCQCGIAFEYPEQALNICNFALINQDYPKHGNIYQALVIANALNGNPKNAHENIQKYSNWIDAVSHRSEENDRTVILNRMRDNIPLEDDPENPYKLPPQQIEIFRRQCIQNFITTR